MFYFGKRLLSTLLPKYVIRAMAFWQFWTCFRGIWAEFKEEPDCLKRMGYTQASDLMVAYRTAYFCLALSLGNSIMLPSMLRIRAVKIVL
ncbi:MAG: hypothetical protein D6736_16900 [Nitrospinota bacterium]|nr:MAG: hypothetical protein D6736_16900 [Nitrospinota bacterium]